MMNKLSISEKNLNTLLIKMKKDGIHENEIYYGNIYNFDQWLALNKDRNPKYTAVMGDFTSGKVESGNLKDSPIYVSGTFDCSDANISSLKGCPKYIGYSFYARNNKIKSLECFPNFVGGDVDFKDNVIEDIPEGFLKNSQGYVSFENNKLKSLSKNSLLTIDGDFDISHNNINNPDNFPEYISGEFFYEENNIDIDQWLDSKPEPINLCKVILLRICKINYSFEEDNSVFFNNSIDKLLFESNNKEQLQECLTLIEKYKDKWFNKESKDSIGELNNMIEKRIIDLNIKPSHSNTLKL